MTKSNASIFVLTCNRPNDLKKCLDSILKQTFLPDEIIIVNNGNNLATEKILNQYPAKVINDKTKKLSHLFNVGWKNCKNEIIGFLADDTIADPYWLENILKVFKQNPNAGVVTGPVVSTIYPAGEMHRLYLKTQKNRFLKFLTLPHFKYIYENKILLPGHLCESGAYSLGAGLKESKNFPEQEIDLATTTSMGIRKSVLKKINGFDENFYFNHADGDLFIRIKADGYKIIFNPDIVVLHQVRLGPSRHSFYIGRDSAYFILKDIKPKTFSGKIGYVSNILLLNFYFLFKRQIKGNIGFARGIYDYIFKKA